MGPLLAATILYGVSAYATSGAMILPAAALAEALAPERASRELYLWLGALVLPHIAAAAAVLYATRVHALDPVDWGVRRLHVRHLSFWWIISSPDAAYRVRFVAIVVAVLLTVGLIRPLVSALLAWRYARRLDRSSTHIPELDVWLTPLSRPWSTCVGFFRTGVYVTQGAVELLDPDELAAVLAHEQAHADRRDNLRLLVAQAALGPLLIMPSARYAFRRLQAAAERAADQAAATSPEDRQNLASALVKAARKLRDFHAEPDEETLRRRMASRYREEFVAERAEQLLDAADGDGSIPEPRSRLALLSLSMGTLVLLGLLVISAGLVGPTVRSLYESLLRALERGM